MLDRNKLTDKQKKQAIEYLSFYKKPYSERTISESILVDCLYEVEFIGSVSLRYFGAMESALVIEKFIDRGKPFDFLKEKQKFMFMNFTKDETYNNFIIRKSKEFLKERGII